MNTGECCSVHEKTVEILEAVQKGQEMLSQRVHEIETYVDKIKKWAFYILVFFIGGMVQNPDYAIKILNLIKDLS